MKERSIESWVTVALVGVALAWGATFVMVKDAVALYPLYGFLGWRFGLASVAFIVLFPRSLTRISLSTLRVGIMAGALLCAGYVFQTWGLEDTTASKAAFITGMVVVITPVLQAVVLRRRPRWVTLVGVVLAVAGLWFLSGASLDGWNVGDTRVLACAFAYAAHMIVLGGIGREHDVSALTFVQLLTVGVVCAAISFATESPSVPSDGSVWVALLVTALLASAAAFWIQTLAQRHISPTKTALILIMEPVFGGLFGWLAGDAFGFNGLVGSVLIVMGMVVVELLGSRAAEHEQIVFEPSIEVAAIAVVEPVEDAP